jgi:hypothetical protein
LAWLKSQQADDILFQPKRFEDLSCSPPYTNSGAYFSEFGCGLVDIDTDVGRSGQGISKGQSADTPAAEESISTHRKGKKPI